MTVPGDCAGNGRSVCYSVLPVSLPGLFRAPIIALIAVNSLPDRLRNVSWLVRVYTASQYFAGQSVERLSPVAGESRAFRAFYRHD